MTVATATTFDVVPLSRHIGAEVRGIDLHDAPDAETVKRLRQAWLDHAVLLFRGQKLEQEDLLRVTEYFGAIGPLGRPVKFFPAGYSRLLPNIMMISNIRENGETIGALPDGEMNFHHDMIHHDLPHNGTLLYSLEIPRHGGDTLFAIPRSRRSSKAAVRGTSTITARRSVTRAASAPRRKPRIRCSALMRRPAARPSMSTA
jgi:alpha-ketoglutarate-dependent taurine dioxygenase